ncbi:MAG TPA: Maf family nucleotide pyrophosphatase [Rudaea sp.]|nr:Maf family nucleotide pyrophosphatase [Rudaea sp.]
MKLDDVDLVLASTSRYRRGLLARLTPRFRTLAPRVDEIVLSGETAADAAVRLAQAKARAIAAQCASALVIGSDQTAERDGAILGKAGSAQQAQAQLAAASGRRVIFHTALCLIDTRGATPIEFTAIDTTHVFFRRLGREEIARYVEREQPLDCAGSFKAEALGIALFERIESQDPTALVGLPLIALCRLLREAGVDVI